MIRLFTFITLLLPLVSFAPYDPAPTAVVKTDADKMVTDNFGNVYLIKNESITKYDVKGTLQKSFSNKTFGAITSADATNALRIVLFYKDFNRIVLLDNTMSQIGDPVLLENLGYSLASLAASSHDNGLWIYDRANFELLRLNRNLQVENRSGNLSQLLGIELQPNFLIEKDNRLFLNNPSTGIMIFDVYGTYSKTIPKKDLKNFQVIDDNIIFYQKPSQEEINILTLNETYFDNEETEALDMRIEKNASFFLLEKELDIFEH